MMISEEEKNEIGPIWIKFPNGTFYDAGPIITESVDHYREVMKRKEEKRKAKLARREKLPWYRSYGRTR